MADRDPKPTGRYRKSYVKRCLKMARKGDTVKMMAASFGVSSTTFYKWVHKYPDFNTAYEQGRDFFNKLHVGENNLLKVMAGYKYTEVKTEKVKNKNGESVTKKVFTIKHVKPDTTAIIFYLHNRDPERWPNRQTIEVSDPEEFEKRLRKANDRVRKTFKADGKVLNFSKPARAKESK